MKHFTIIGIWLDTGQRFATHVQAKSALEAEAICESRFAGVTICGVLRGRQCCVDEGLGRKRHAA